MFLSKIDVNKFQKNVLSEINMNIFAWRGEIPRVRAMRVSKKVILGHVFRTPQTILSTSRYMWRIHFSKFIFELSEIPKGPIGNSDRTAISITLAGNENLDFDHE